MNLQEEWLYREQQNEPDVEDDIIQYLEYLRDIPFKRRDEISLDQYKQLGPDEIVEIAFPNIDKEIEFNNRINDEDLDFILSKSNLRLFEMENVKLSRREATHCYSFLRELNLTDKQRHVIFLYYCLEIKSQSFIAKTLDVTQQAVSKHLKAAEKKISKKMK